MTPEPTEGLIALIIEFCKQNQDLVALIVFLMGLGESLVLVSLFIPSTMLFVAIGAAHSAAGGELWPVWAAGAAGAVLGDVISFAAGRHMRHNIKMVWPFRQYPRLLARGRAMFARWGAMTILFSKFMGNIRPFLPVAAGAMRMRWTTFTPMSVLSSIVWAGVFLAPGYGMAMFWR